MMACKSALQKQKAMEKAIEILRKRSHGGRKEIGRETSEGAIATSGRAIASVRCETDFVARVKIFENLYKTLLIK